MPKKAVSEIYFEGKKYFSLAYASDHSGYHRDYLGQLIRKGSLPAKKIGFAWFIDSADFDVFLNSLHAEAVDFMRFEGKEYISLKNASKLAGYHKDYLGQLARKGELEVKKIGFALFVEKNNFIDFCGRRSIVLPNSFAQVATPAPLTSPVVSSMLAHEKQKLPEEIKKEPIVVASDVPVAAPIPTQATMPVQPFASMQREKGEEKQIMPEKPSWWRKKKIRLAFFPLALLLVLFFSPLDLGKIGDRALTFGTDLIRTYVLGTKYAAPESAPAVSSTERDAATRSAQLLENLKKDILAYLDENKSKEKDVTRVHEKVTEVVDRQEVFTPVNLAFVRQDILGSVDKINGQIRDQFNTTLEEFKNQFTSSLAGISTQDQRGYQGNFQAIAVSQRIDNLSGTHLSNITVSGVSGLTDADIPNDITITNGNFSSLGVSGSGTSTFAGGINLTSGCFAVNGTCITSGGGSGTPAGSTGAVQFNSTGSFGADATNFFWDDTNKRLGIGTSSPAARLSVSGNVFFDSNNFTFGSSSASTLVLSYQHSSTSTIPALVNAWSIATSTTALPLVSFDGASQGSVGFGTAKPGLIDGVDIQGSQNFRVLNVSNGSSRAIVNVEGSYAGFSMVSPTASVSQRWSFLLNNGTGTTFFGINDDAASTIYTPFTITHSNGFMGVGSGSAPYSSLQVMGSSTAPQAFAVVSSASSTLLQVLNSGNIGIGTSSPSAGSGYGLGPTNLIFHMDDPNDIILRHTANAVESAWQTYGVNDSSAGTYFGSITRHPLYLLSDNTSLITLSASAATNTITYSDATDDRGLVFAYSTSSTSTIPSKINAWSLGTSTVDVPILSIDASNAGSVGIGTAQPSLINGAVYPSNYRVLSLSATSGLATVGIINIESNSGSLFSLIDHDAFGSNRAYMTTINNSNGKTIFSATTSVSSLNINGLSGNIGINDGGTPYSKLQVNGSSAGSSQIFAVVSSASSTILQVLETGNVGIGTTSPGSVLSVHGSALLGTTTVAGLTATGSINVLGTATSSFASGINISSGCFAIGNTCLSTSGNGANPFSFTTNYGGIVAATSSSIWLQNPVYASSTLTVAGNTSLGNGTSSVLTFNAGTINYPVYATTTIPTAVNAWSVATTTAGNDPILSVSGNGFGSVGVGTAQPTIVNSVNYGNVGRSLAVKSTGGIAFLTAEGTAGVLSLVDNNASANQKHSVIQSNTGQTLFQIINDSASTAFSPLTFNHSNGYVGVSSTSPGLPFAVVGNTLFDSNVISYGSSSAATLTFAYQRSSTSTIPASINAWSVATGTTAVPILSVSGSGNIGKVFVGGAQQESASSFNSALNVKGAGGDGSVLIESPTPRIYFYETDMSTDNKAWDILAGTESLLFRAINDSNSLGSSFLTVNRTGTTIDAVVFPNGLVGVGTTSPSTNHLLSVSGGTLLDSNTITLASTSARTGLTIRYATTSTSTIPNMGNSWVMNDTAGNILLVAKPYSSLGTGVLAIGTSSVPAAGVGALGQIHAVGIQGSLAVVTGGSPTLPSLTTHVGLNGYFAGTCVSFGACSGLVVATSFAPSDTSGSVANVINSAPVQYSGTTTTLYGVNVSDVTYTAGRLTNQYGVRIAAQTVGSTTWNLYSEGANSQNYFGGKVGVGTTTPWGWLSIEQQSSTSTPLLFIGDQGTSSPHFLVDGRGRVGIGTSTPAGQLQVSAGLAPQLVLSDTNGGTNAKHWYASSTNGAFAIGSMTDAYAMTERARIDSNGNFLVGTTTTGGLTNTIRAIFDNNSPSDTVTSLRVGNRASSTAIALVAGRSVYADASRTGIEYTTTSDFAIGQALDSNVICYVGHACYESSGLYTNPQFIIKKTSYNVGISTSSPAERLSVNGNMLVSGTTTVESNLLLANDTSSIKFSAADSSNAPMIYMFASGTSNGDRMVLAHSPAFPTWGLQYSDATDDFVFLSGGTEVMRVDLGSESVGIGSGDVPDGKLEVVQSAAADILNLYDGATNVFTVVNGGSVGIGTTTPRALLSVQGSALFAGTSTAQTFFATSSAYFATAGGRVAIGTSTQSTNVPALIVVTAQDAASNLDASGILVYNNGGNDAQLRLGSNVSANALWSIATGGNTSYAGATDNLYFYKETGSAGTKMVLTDSGALGLGSTTPWGQLSVEKTISGVPTFAVGDQGSTTPWFVVNQNGRIGINTATPSYQFEVKGLGAGSGYQVISSDASAKYLALGGDWAYIDSYGGGRLLLNFNNSEDVDIRNGLLYANASLNHVGVGTSTPWGLLSVEQPSGSAPVFVVGDSGTSTPHLIVSAAGNVGIGSSTPYAELSILGRTPASVSGTALDADFALYVQGGTGGATSGAASGGKGGGIYLAAGNGGLGSVFPTNGGTGGSITLKAGDVSGSGWNDGTPGVISLIAGSQPIAVNSPSGRSGGVIDIRAGTGTVARGCCPGDGTGSNGGAITISGGAGGSSVDTGGAPTIPNGGDVVINGGREGSRSGTTPGLGLAGNILLGSVRGFVGVGTTSPWALLSVEQTASTTLNFAVGDAGTSSPHFVIDGRGQSGFGTSTPWGQVSIEQGSSSNPVFVIGDQGTATPSFFVSGRGFIGVGTTTPGAAINITNGALCVDDATPTCGNSARTAGTIYAVSTSITGIDVAENYPTSDTNLAAGDLVSFDASQSVYVVKADRSATSTATVVGVVSTAPGVELGGFGIERYPDAKKVPIALTGRVPVKVSLENGPIAQGDAIAASSIPGFGMKARPGDSTVGIALESFDGVSVNGASASSSDTGTILVFIHLSENRLAVSDEPAVQEIQQKIMSIEDRVAALEQVIGIGSTTSATPPASSSMMGDMVASVVSALRSFGVELTNGILTVQKVIAQTLFVDHAIVKNLEADTLKASAAELGSSEAPAGLTMYDRNTHQPYCVSVENGDIAKTPGACASAGVPVSSDTSQPSSTAADTSPSSSTDISTGSTTPSDSTTTPVDAGGSPSGDASTNIEPPPPSDDSQATTASTDSSGDVASPSDTSLGNTDPSI